MTNDHHVWLMGNMNQLSFQMAVCYNILIKMKSAMQNGDLSVDQIIERVLVRNNQQPYAYTKKSDSLLTSQEHLWHYRLQQQNLQLKEKLKNLNLQLRKKMQHHTKCTTLQKQINALRVELQGVIQSNTQLQEQINQMRLKNSYINDSIQHSLDQSIRNRKHNRSCSCVSSHNNQKNTHRVQKAQKIRINESSPSPEKEILKTKKDVSVMCLMPWCQNSQVENIAQKKEHIKALRNIVENQEKLLQAYLREIQQKRPKAQLYKTKTMQSTSRMVHGVQHTISHNTFKPLSSAGSIVKVRRG